MADGARQRSRSTVRPRQRATPNSRALVSPSRSRNRQARPSSGTTSDVLSDFFHAVFSPLSDPGRSGVVIAMLVLSVLAVYLHYADPSSSWITALSDSLDTTVVFKPVAQFIRKDTIKLIGLILLIPSVCAPPSTLMLGFTRRSRMRTPPSYVLYILFSLPILWFKAYTYYDYLLYSFCVYLLIQLRTNFHRVFVLLILTFGWVLLNRASKPSLASNPVPASASKPVTH